MIKQDIKVYVVLNGLIVDVAVCSTEQARWLCEGGLADWNDGQLRLKSVQNTSVRPNKIPILNSADDLEGMLVEAGIDPTLPGWESVRSEHREPSSDSRVSSLSKLLLEFRRCLGSGHQTCDSSDPVQRTIGFTDTDTGSRVSVSLATVKERTLTDEDAAALGMTRDDLIDLLHTHEGRTTLFGTGEYGDWSKVPPSLDVEWGDCPSWKPLPNPTVGLSRVIPLATFDVRRDGLQEIVHKYRNKHPFVPAAVPGWTFFSTKDSHQVIPVYEDGIPHPKTIDVAYGLFRRHKSRLYRIWLHGHPVAWDESDLMDDGTYEVSLTIRDWPIAIRPGDAAACAACVDEHIKIQNAMRSRP